MLNVAGDGLVVLDEISLRMAIFSQKRAKGAEPKSGACSMMDPMNLNTPSVILTTEAFTSRPELHLHAETKCAKLFRHLHPRVQLVRVHVKHYAPHAEEAYFAARATAEHSGPDHVVHAEGNEPESAINAVVDKLERALASAAGLRKHQMHHSGTTAEARS